MENDGILEPGIEVAMTEEVVPAQKMLTQEQVNALIGREKKEAAEKARREVEARYEGELQRLKTAGNTPSASSPQSFDDIYAQVEQRLMQKAQEHQDKLAREEHEQQMQSIADGYFNKMSSGKDLFEDFDEVMSDFKPSAFPELIFLASEMENTPQIMYELAKNPHKLATIHSLARADAGQAKKALKKLSESIAYNEQAQDEYVSTNPPLSKPKPSQVSTEKGYNSVKDYRNASWLKT